MRLKFYSAVLFLIGMTISYSQDSSKSIRKIEDLNTQEDPYENIVLQKQGPKGSIYGKVTDEDNEPVPFAQIVVIEDYEGIRMTKKGTKSTVQGEYILKDLAPGFYNLMFKSLGRERIIETRVEVKADNMTQLNAKFTYIRRGCLTYCCGTIPRVKTVEKARVEKKEELFNFYPNPCRGNLTVEPPKNAYLLEIYDIKGKKIYTNDLREAKAKIDIDLNPYLNGIYFIICTASGNKKYYEKLELQK
jgi:hypothetical protein